MMYETRRKTLCFFLPLFFYLVYCYCRIQNIQFSVCSILKGAMFLFLFPDDMEGYLYYETVFEDSEIFCLFQFA